MQVQTDQLSSCWDSTINDSLVLQRPRLHWLVSSSLHVAKQPFLYVLPLQHRGRSRVGSHFAHLPRHTPACRTCLMMATLLHFAKQQLAKVEGPYWPLLAQ